MPNIPLSYTQIAGQVDPSTQPASTQFNFGQLYRRIQQFNPQLDPTMAQLFVNNSYRRVIDSRSWYGLLVKGQITVPNAYSTGTCTVTQGSNTVTLANGGTIDSTFIGRQFRVGFSQPIYTINGVINGTTFTLDLPWGSQASASSAYMIFKNIVSLGSNVKRVLAVVNQNQGFRLKLGMPQEVINIYDTWRTQTGWTYMLASYAPAPDGSPQWELYPAPTFQQAFPFLVYVQPPDMVSDGDFPYSFIRSDVILYGALSDAAMFQGKSNPQYDPNAAGFWEKRFAQEIEKMCRVDDNQYPQDLTWEFGAYPFTSFGADFYQNHDSGLGFF